MKLINSTPKEKSNKPKEKQRKKKIYKKQFKNE